MTTRAAFIRRQGRLPMHRPASPAADARAAQWFWVDVGRLAAPKRIARMRHWGTDEL